VTTRNELAQLIYEMKGMAGAPSGLIADAILNRYNVTPKDDELFEYEEIRDAPAVGSILIGAVGICLGIITILLLIGTL
jgi:preprotein translocase subunit Sss1